MPTFERPNALLDVFQAAPATARPLIAYHEALLRGPGAFSLAERELIAAFVSALNACGYCHGIHAETARRFGVDPGLLEQLVRDLDAAPLDPRLLPVLRFARKLTETPARIVDADRSAILRAGWPAQAVYEAASICGLFNLMNRLVDGLGIALQPGYAAVSAARLHEGGYAGLLAWLDDPPPDAAGEVRS